MLDWGEASIPLVCDQCEEAADEIDRLRAEIDVWVEYVTCDRADLVLRIEQLEARANDPNP
jgi:hypothetical protein